MKLMFSKHATFRLFSTTNAQCKKIIPSRIKGASSQNWMLRQLNDPYVEKAKILNYRCRSAFKLLEMDDKFHLLRPGQMVIDCGAAPGSWTQVAVNKVNANASNGSELVGKVIAIDKQHMHPIEGAILFDNSDFTSSVTQEKVMEKLGQHKADVIISDMAPTVTGVRYLDNENMIHLCYIALQFAVKVSAIDASLVVKLWHSGELKTLETNMSRFYKSVRLVKPNASRSDSAEIFILARNFKGVKEVV